MASMQSLYLSVLFTTLFFCLPAQAKGTLAQEIKEHQAVISEKQLRLNTYQQRLSANHQHINDAQRDLNNADIDLKKLHRETRRIESLAATPISAIDKQQLHHLAYKTKVAEMSLKKQQDGISELKTERIYIESRSQRLSSLLSRLHTELDTKKQHYKVAKKNWAQAHKKAQSQQLAEQKHQQRLEKQQQEQAAKIELDTQTLIAQQAASKKRHDKTLALLAKIAAKAAPATASKAEAETWALLTKLANQTPTLSSINQANILDQKNDN